MYYIGTVLLNMSEETFWKCTPRKLFALLDCYIDANMTEEQKSEQGIKGRKHKQNSSKNNKEVVNQIASW